MLRKTGIGFLAFIVVAAVCSSGAHFWYSAQAAAADERLSAALARSEFPTVELRDDVDALRGLLEAVHPVEIASFPLGEYEDALKRLATSVEGPLDHLGFYRQIAPVANLLDDEHTMVFPPDRNVSEPAGTNDTGFPVEVAIIDGRLYAASSRSEHVTVRAGAEILSINRVTADLLVRTLEQYYSGTTPSQKRTYLQHDFANALSLAYGMSPPFAVEMRDSESGEVTSHDWPGVKLAGTVHDTFSFDVVQPGTMLFTYNAFEDDEGRFDDFLADLFTTARDEGIRTLLIDIRRNQGGAAEFGDRILAYLAREPFTQVRHVDVTVSEYVREEFLSYVPGFLRWLPVRYVHPFLRPLWTNDPGEVARIEFREIAPPDNPLGFEGDIVVLVGPGTMSSASLFAAALQHYELATLVGEETGGYATMYGNIVDARLPNTGLKVWMPTSVVYGQSDGPVVPKHVVRRSASDLAASRDAVLEFALQLAADQSND